MQRRNAAGFSLIEALITLVVVGVGLLGLAKIQAAAVGNTQVSRMRSLVALQTESLVAAMHGNRGFWAVANTAPATFSASGVAVTDSNSVLSATVTSCPDGGGNGCTPVKLAAYDFQQWASWMNRNFPGYSATGNCTTVVPVNCNVTVTWNEKYIAVNSTTASAAAAAPATTQQSYTLYVQP
ncbi:prepilin-type N-terminal cleavage/methylation domain-containing protein [Ralstonia sp. A12]|uniref:prepilin-type N-terminal cleavage/methylation domain-containing protein n=1 Tax=Ralstonia sp. A12 TaxID=1217052 RepID=UPI000AB22250|nr:prepilin-type N-terminal cleavage/methylation domain-containing protein [Ralstonia sp. A12]